ncbi:inner membrane protein YjdF-like [Paramacrobiotus metropolitanus]|uniref:inner membrane protein YjdF-like n=1 Tax=Paramacrobiotus metropolitanus TaxID=2943436 RepID=UPI00244633B7|nr:inner membrane protein YjdF-like [Paramacrobiotus metropolitanus]XP_055328700.1 inner membrane protein YjdF-like [Paramacrobiotus metropolitanus]
MSTQRSTVSARKPLSENDPSRTSTTPTGAPQSWMELHEPRVLFILTCVAMVVSFIGCAEVKIWFMEAAPVLVAIPFLLLRYRKFRLTPLLYRLMFLHSLILLGGAHYTYAKVPIGFWFQRMFNLKRNHYDRLGHFAQGFVPAILAREVLIRKEAVRKGAWLNGIVICICAACSAYYEIVEWWTAASGADDSGDFMGSQGDIYDAQWDMFLCVVGACCSLVFLSEKHDEQLAKIKRNEKF